MIKNIFCDLDGVLVDLNAGYKALTGMTMPESDQYHNYDHGAFWEKPKADPEFWVNLPKMRKAEMFMTYLDDIRHGWFHVFVLSSGVRGYRECSTQKRLWVNKNTPFSAEYTHIVRRSEKQMFATSKGRPNLLIDDYEVNINEWEAAGGIGILYDEDNFHNVINRIEEFKTLRLEKKHA